MTNNKDSKKILNQQETSGNGELTPEQEQEVNYTVIYQTVGGNPYKARESNIDFSIIFNGDRSHVEGALTTSAFIADTELEFLQTWRFTLANVKISRIDISSGANKLVYVFTAESFTCIDAEEGQANG